jgi:hypothetical protein
VFSHRLIALDGTDAAAGALEPALTLARVRLGRLARMPTKEDAMDRTDAERQALEWLRDENERFNGVAHGVRDALQGRGRLTVAVQSIAGTIGSTICTLTGLGRQALGGETPRGELYGPSGLL